MRSALAMDTHTSLADIELELAIDMEIDRCMAAHAKAEAVAAIERAGDLHRMRRPHMVELVARRLGLRQVDNV